MTADWLQHEVPTHHCVTCGALWRFWPERDTGRADSWNLRSERCGPCCDTVAMGEQIKPLTVHRMLQWVAARHAVDEMLMRVFGPRDPSEVN